MPGIHLQGDVVEEDSQDDHQGPETGQEGDLVPEQDHGTPDEEGALTRISNAMRDGTNVVHENVGRYGLEVEEGSVDDQTEQHGGVYLRHLGEVHEEEGNGNCDDDAGDAGVELELGRAVPHAVAGDQHLRVHVLNRQRNQSYQRNKKE